jgi:hypothetical protein
MNPFDIPRILLSIITLISIILITYFYFFSMHTLFNLFCTILANPSMVNLTLVTYLLFQRFLFN